MATIQASKVQVAARAVGSLSNSAQPASRPGNTQQPQQPAQPSAPGKLLTETEVLAWLKREIAATSLAEVAKRYQIQSSQISDILYGRANMSARVVKLLKLRMHKFYERVDAPALGS